MAQRNLMSSVFVSSTLNLARIQLDIDTVSFLICYSHFATSLKGLLQTVVDLMLPLFCPFLLVNLTVFPSHLGNITLDFPLPRVPPGSFARRLAFPRAAQVHQLLCQSVRLHASAVHTVQGGLRAV